MLAALSIRDIVLIDRLDLEFGRGLSVFTGETGAGKSILLDALALALGGRGDASLVRRDAAQGRVTAVFDLAETHKVFALLAENGIAAEDGLILRRLQGADGRSRRPSVVSSTSVTRRSASAPRRRARRPRPTARSTSRLAFDWSQ